MLADHRDEALLSVPFVHAASPFWCFYRKISFFGIFIGKTTERGLISGASNFFSPPPAAHGFRLNLWFSQVFQPRFLPAFFCALRSSRSCFRRAALLFFATGSSSLARCSAPDGIPFASIPRVPIVFMVHTSLISHVVNQFFSISSGHMSGFVDPYCSRSFVVPASPGAAASANYALKAKFY